jgi:hypothetical protein
MPHLKDIGSLTALLLASSQSQSETDMPPPATGGLVELPIPAPETAFLVKETPHYLQVRFAEGHEVVWVEKKRVAVEKVPPVLGKTKVVEITAPVWRVLKWGWPIGL